MTAPTPDRVPLSDVVRAARAALRDVRDRPPPWTPLPHQVPPPGDWYGWLLLAGRGAGKTDACARYVAEHVAGPPCLRGDAPHWVGIVAPTLGDAVTACYAGPSGLRAHDPTCRLVQSPGGTVVRWTNGSEAKLFGAREPEDVERLRAGGNRSLVGSTLVRTERGPRPLRDVAPGDWVWTRNGLRRVLAAHEHGERPIWRVELTDGRTLDATADHEVWTGFGWRRVDELRPGGTVTTWAHATLRTTESGGTNGRRATSPTHVADCCIGTSTRARSARSHPARTYTTAITTGRTTTPPTWSRCGPASTCSCTRDATSRRRTAAPDSPRRPFVAASELLVPDRAVAVSVLTAADGSKTLTRTLATVMRTYAEATDSSSEPAPSAASPSTRRSTARHASVASRVATWPSGVVDPVVRHTPNGCAPCAAVGLPATFGAPPARALARVRTARPLTNADGVTVTEPVYDVTVEHDHEFFANDVLVKNCLVWLEELAAWRYLQACWEQVRFGLRAGARPRWVASTTPKPRPLIKKLALPATTPADVVVTRASTRDNPHLPADVRRALDEEYGGTQLGRQELDAELLEEDRDALWTRETLDRTRLVAAPPRSALARVSVGVDPSGGAGEQGIVVVAKVRADALAPYLPGSTRSLNAPRPPDPPASASSNPVDATGGFAAARSHAEHLAWHGVVLDDRTCTLPPAGWGRRAVRAAVDWEADELVVEVNYGGAMATATLLDACDAEGVSLPVREVRASRGKRVRAEPVSALFARGRGHLAGLFPELEDQLCTWTAESGFSPDRLDALVWPFWHLRLASTASRGIGSLATELARTSLTGGR